MLDEDKIANAFAIIAQQALALNEVLGRNDVLNENVPTSWPLNFSAYEFAHECFTMRDYYWKLAKARERAIDLAKGD